MSSRARRRRRHGSPLKWLALIVGVFVVLVASAVGAGASWFLRVYNSAPALSRLHPREQPRVTKVYAANGSRLGVIHSASPWRATGSRPR
jgi:membrane carboxypeptidase/penicillin-binding protein